MLAFICASLDRPRQCCVSAFVLVVRRPIGLVLEQESKEREALQLPLKEAIFTVVNVENVLAVVIIIVRMSLWSPSSGLVSAYRE
jgi:hypothetical protein